MRSANRFYTILGWIAIVYLVVLFCYPLGKVIISSVIQNGTFTLDNYIKIFSTELYINVLVKTLWVSLISTLIALVIGYSLALFISTRKKSSQGFWLMLIISPMFMSLTVRLFGWMILLGNGGPVNSMIQNIFGNDAEWKLLFSQTAIVIGIIHYLLPFVVLNIYSALKSIEPSYLEASKMLGASGFFSFWRITFPLSLPGVISASSLAFALSTSAFLVPLMLGGPSDNLLANMAYNAIVNIGNLGMGAALSTVLLIIVIFVLFIMGWIERRGRVA